MTDETVAAVVRPASCQAEFNADYATCARCGLAWDSRLTSGPECKALSKRRIYAALDRAIEFHRQSHEVCLTLQREGQPVDEVASLERMAELQGVRMLVDLCLSNERILDILNPKRRRGDHHG